MKYIDMNDKTRRSIYNRVAYIKRQYGVEISPYDLFKKLLEIKYQKTNMKSPVLTSVDNTWSLESLRWVPRKEMSQPDFGIGSQDSGSKVAPPDSFRHPPLYKAEVETKDWSEDTAFSQDKGYDPF